MAEVETSVYEVYSKALEAWQAVPKMPMKVELQGDFITYSCPICGLCFAQHQCEYNYRFDQPIFCCGKVLI